MNKPVNYKNTQALCYDDPFADWGEESFDDLQSPDDFSFGDPSNDQFVPSEKPPPVSQLQSRLSSLLTLVDQTDYLSGSNKNGFEKEIRFLEAQIRRAQSLVGPSRDSESLRIQGLIADLERRCLSTEPVGPSEGGFPVGDAGSWEPQDAKTRVEDLEKKIEKFHSKGWITDDLYEKLKEKSGRAKEAASDPDLAEVAAGLADDLENSLDQIKQMFVQDGEAVDAVGDDSEEGDKNGTLKALLQLTGASEEQALTAFKQAFPGSGISSAKDLAKAIEKEQAPFTAPPDEKVIQFLETLDAEFAQAVAGCTQYKKESIGPNLEKASARLAGLLSAIYGDDHIIRATQAKTADSYSDWRKLNEITFDGTSYSFTGETKGQTDQVIWEVLDSKGKPVPDSSGNGSGKNGLGLPGGPDVPNAPDLPELPGPGDEIANGAKHGGEKVVGGVKDGAEWVGDKFGL